MNLSDIVGGIDVDVLNFGLLNFENVIMKLNKFVFIHWKTKYNRECPKNLGLVIFERKHILFNL